MFNIPWTEIEENYPVGFELWQEYSARIRKLSSELELLSFFKSQGIDVSLLAKRFTAKSSDGLDLELKDAKIVTLFPRGIELCFYHLQQRSEKCH